MKSIFIVTFASILSIVVSSPPAAEKCISFDDNCLTVVMQNKISRIINRPDQHVGSLTHAYAAEIDTNKDGLELNFTNINIHAGPYIVVDKASLDKNVNSMRIVLRIPRTTFLSQYKAQGTLYGTPFEGEGDVTVESRNEVVDLTMKYDEIKGQNGETYLALKDPFYWFTKDSAVFTFTNLFYGDIARSNAMHLALQNNWRPLAFKYGRVMFDPFFAADGQGFQVIRNIFLQKPINDIILDW